MRHSDNWLSVRSGEFTRPVEFIKPLPFAKLHLTFLQNQLSIAISILLIDLTTLYHFLKNVMPNLKKLNDKTFNIKLQFITNFILHLRNSEIFIQLKFTDCYKELLML